MTKKIPVTFNKAEKSAEILIYGPIGASFWDDSGITAKDFTEALNEIPSGTKITIGINSQGGAIGEGLAIFNAIERRASEITARIDGYALSAGSFIPLAASKVVSPQSAIWMIHKGWSYAQGNADEMRKTADLLDTHDAALIDIYTKRTGKSRDEIESALADETWLTGAEAVAYGLADESDGDIDASAMAAIDLSRGQFKNARAIGTILAGITGSKPNSGNATSPDVIPATISAPHVAAAVAQTKPAATTAQKEPNMSEQIAPAADKSAEILAKLEALESKINTPAAPAAASAPVAPRIENLGNPAIEEYRAMRPGQARADFRVSQHTTLMRELGKVQNSNTIDTALIPDYMSDALITIVGAKLAPLGSFSLGVGLNPMAPRQTVQVSLASAAATTLTNATNFEQGNSTLAGQPVTVDQYTQPFHLTNAELNQGIIINKLAQVNANALADSISDVVTALMVNGNYGAATAIGAASAFTPTGGKLSIIYGLAKNYPRKNLIVDGGHLGYLIPTSRDSFRIGEAGAFGFDLIAEQNRWTNAETNAVGFVCSPDAIAVATGTPLNLPSAEFLSQSTVTLKNGMSVVVSSWYSRAARNVWMSYDMMFGAGVGDASAGEILVTS